MGTDQEIIPVLIERDQEFIKNLGEFTLNKCNKSKRIHCELSVVIEENRRASVFGSYPFFLSFY